LLDVDEILTFENSSLPPAPKERNRFDKNWDDFLKSDPCNDGPPLLPVLGNPASHPVKAGMFFAFEKNKKEHRFWKNILTQVCHIFSFNIGILTL